MDDIARRVGYFIGWVLAIAAALGSVWLLITAAKAVAGAICA